VSVSKDELRAAALAVREGTPAREIIFAGAEWARRRSDGISVLDVLVRRKVLSPQKRRTIELVLGENDPEMLRAMTEAEMPLPEPLLHDETSLRTEPSISSQVEDSLGNDENVGHEIRGRYEARLDEKGHPYQLGKGGIGSVYLVFDRFVGRDVALKELSVPGGGQVDDTEGTSANEMRFLREARVTGQLEHPAIVPVYELGRRTSGSLYYTMRRVVGKNLHQAIREAKTLEKRLDLLPHFLAMCQALAYAHSRAVIHRDVKPQNVMIGQFGETYVLDWGLARVKGKADPRREELKLAPDITGDSLGGAIGTPAYMSPEQARGQVDEIDERSDVFGLGAVLYELVTGRPPYLGPSPIEVVERVRQFPPDPVLTIEPAAPRELADVVQRAMSRAREDRYATAESLANDIEAWRAGRRVSAHAYSSWELLKGFGRKNRIAIAITVVALGALSTAAAFAWWQVGKERDEARAFAQFYLDDVSPALAQLPGADELISTLTRRTLSHYERTVNPSSGTYADRLHMAQALLRVGRLAYRVGQLDDARATFSRSRELLEALVRETETDHLPAQSMAEALTGLGDVDADQFREADAELRYATAVEFSRRAERLAPDDNEVLDTQSRTLSRLGQLLADQGRLTAARPLLESAVMSDEKWLKISPHQARARTSLCLTLSFLGNLKADLGRGDEAEGHFRRALALAEAALAVDPDDFDAGESKLGALNDLGKLALRRAGPQAASEVLAKAAAQGEALLARNAEHTDISLVAAHTWLMLGNVPAASRITERVRARANAPEWELVWMQLDLLNGRYEQVLSAAPNTTRGNRGIATLQASMAAALMGDKDKARTLLAEAEQLVPRTRMAWFPRTELEIPRLDGKNKAQVQAFAHELERAWSAAHLEAMQEAVRRFAAALGPR
jgi:tetratricopeptide (TPR) repeat protein